MTLEPQHVWGTLIVIYLFLGGLGGACLTLASIAVYSKRILPIIAPWASVTLSATAEEAGSHRPNRVFTLAMSLSGVGFLAIGSLMLLLDLLHPGAVFYLFSNPTSWIFWGTIFILITLISGALYGWAQAAPTFEWLAQWATQRIGVRQPEEASDAEGRKKSSSTLLSLLRTMAQLLATVGQKLERFERFNGFVAGWFGFATAFYTGFLVSMAPAIPFWSTPALPLLFLVSAFSTAAAYALLVVGVIRHYQKGLEQRIEGFDVGLIVFEILILLAYFNSASIGSVGFRTSLHLLLSEPGFWIGVLFLGLIVPLAMEFLSLWRRSGSPRLERVLKLTSAVLVLVGGFLLRYYILKVGVFQFPW